MSDTASVIDEQFMRRAMRLAMNGRGRVEPNPMVGCVLVKGGRAIGEGYHERFGGPHAEPAALAACSESAEGATAYVTLEPCCHTNKKTPPCVPALLGAKVARVVVGCLDPNPEVNGNGLRLLREAGVDVVGPVLESEAKQLIAPFLARVRHARPYVTLKWAESSDGRIAGKCGVPVLIGNEDSARAVHQLRARSDAVAVSINTVLADNPRLTVRGVDQHRPLLRVVLDRQLRIRLSCILVSTAKEIPTIVYTQPNAGAIGHARAALDAWGVTVVSVAGFRDALHDLHGRGVTHLLVEPGASLATSLFRKADAVDRLWVIRSPRPIGDAGLTAAAVPDGYVATSILDLGGDQLTEYLNPGGPLFYAPSASADLVLTAHQRRNTADTGWKPVPR